MNFVRQSPKRVFSGGVIIIIESIGGSVELADRLTALVGDLGMTGSLPGRVTFCGIAGILGSFERHAQLFLWHGCAMHRVKRTEPRRRLGTVEVQPTGEPGRSAFPRVHAFDLVDRKPNCVNVCTDPSRIVSD